MTRLAAFVTGFATATALYLALGAWGAGRVRGRRWNRVYPSRDGEALFVG